ncbi:MAG: hypothetical protein IPM16_06780 [Chloroflexi bacterium]|nr:hypothetical protein [Chloroflexota bacterium]
MSFSFGEDLSNDLDWVRFKIGDTVADEAYLSDALIASLLATSASKQHAAIAAVQYVLTQFSRPDFKADWLEVKRSTAEASFRRVLTRLESEFGFDVPGDDGGLSGSNVMTYRVDSAQTSAPDFTEGRP